MTKRKVIRIDEEKCDGCGLCVPACAEGAIEIKEGKARLISEKYCDGLGACLGECPRGAISIEEREAGGFDEKAVTKHLRHEESFCSCPSTRIPALESNQADIPAVHARSYLTHWPVQLRLVPPTAPYLQDAHLLICADCVPFVYAPFHQELLRGRVILIGCPKLDDAEFYVHKLTEIFKANELKSVTVAHVEVPCCFGLRRVVEEALTKFGQGTILQEVVVGIKGDLRQGPRSRSTLASE